jgi:hypothetical protein
MYVIALHEFLESKGHEVCSINPEEILTSMGNDIPRARGRVLAEVCRQGIIADLILIDYDFGMGWGKHLTGENIVRAFHEYPNKKFLGISSTMSDYTSISFPRKLELSVGIEAAKDDLLDKIQKAMTPRAFRIAEGKRKV